MHRIPYVKTLWEDHIVDIVDDEVIQEGTRFTASRANNIEEGIFNAYKYLDDYDDELTRIGIQLEMLGRAPTNNGTFFDPIDDDGTTKALKLLVGFSVVQNALSAGVTSIVVEDGSKFIKDEYITIYDEEKIESKKISNIVDNTLTVATLTNPYKKGAIVAKSNAVIKGNKLTYQTWGNYKIEVKEVI